MVYRTRERSHGNLFGSADSFSPEGHALGHHASSVVPTFIETTTDSTPYGGYFNSDKYGMSSTTGLTFSRTNFDGIRFEFSSWLPPTMEDVTVIQHLAPQVIDVPGTGGDLAVELLKRTNPSRPSVSIPTFLGEGMEDVKKLPETIKERGANYASNLGVRFGILPFVSDVLKMTRISEAVDKRSRELVRLNNKGGARVKRVFSDHTYTATSPGQLIFAEEGTWTEGVIVTQTRSKVWGFCRWIPDGSFNTVIQGGKANRAEIRKICLGIGSNKNISGYGRDAWNLIPFSWLADWYGNFGDLLAANQNDNLAHPEGVGICQHLLTLRTFKCPYGSITMYRDTKLRSFPSHLQLAWSNPILSADQMSILTSLTQRNPRSGRAFRPSGGGSPPPIG